MNKKYYGPNDEVEAWKDTVYEETKNLYGKELTNYFKKNADRILKKYDIKCQRVHIIAKSKELTRV
ncbi:MAG: hypothetical protein AABY84_07655 [Candidatus Firestonebacteria bacterium]